MINLDGDISDIFVYTSKIGQKTALSSMNKSYEIDGG